MNWLSLGGIPRYKIKIKSNKAGSIELHLSNKVKAYNQNP
jgi:hypothetical protein